MASPALRAEKIDASRWIITPICLSLLLHFLLAIVIPRVKLADPKAFDQSVEKVFQLQTWEQMDDKVHWEQPDTAAMKPEDRRAEKKKLMQEFELPPRELPPDYELVKEQLRKTMPSEDTSADERPIPRRYDEEQVPIVARKGTQGIAQGIVHDGELDGTTRETIDNLGLRGGGKKVTRALPEIKVIRLAADTFADPGEPVELPTIEPVMTAEVKLPEPMSIKPEIDDLPMGFPIPIDESVMEDEPTGGSEDTVPRIDDESWKPPENPPGEEDPPQPLNDVEVVFEVYDEPDDPRSYFRLTIREKSISKLKVIPKDVLFVIDVSLSIGQEELEAVREGVAQYLRAMAPGDRFNVIVFSEQTRGLFADFVSPTPRRVDTAIRFIRRFPGEIKTDVYLVMKTVVGRISSRRRPCNVFLISDGKSTTGVRDAKRIVNDFSKVFRPNFAIFTFDVGKGGDRYLLDLLSYRSKGYAAWTDEPAHAPARLAQLCGQFGRPVFFDLRPEYGNLEVDETYPQKLPNLYKGKPIVIYGRCKPRDHVAMHLFGQASDGRREFFYNTSLPKGDPDNSRIALEWARGKIHWLVSAIAKEGSTPEKVQEIERLSEQYGIVTPYTKKRTGLAGWLFGG